MQENQRKARRKWDFEDGSWTESARNNRGKWEFEDVSWGQAAGSQKNGARSDGAAARETFSRQETEGAACFGGQIFRASEYGRPVLAFASGVSGGEDDASYYALFGSISPHFFTFLHPDPRKPHIFIFQADPDEKSVREWFRECQAQPTKKAAPLPFTGEHVLRELVRTIAEYYEFQKKNGGIYRPLKAISADTVFLNAKGQVRLLPLKASRDAYPVELPSEARTARANEKTDLASAVYLSMEIDSGRLMDEADGDTVHLQRPVEEWKRDCLLMIPDWRPSLREVIGWLDSDRSRQSTPPRPEPIVRNPAPSDTPSVSGMPEEEDSRQNNSENAAASPGFFGKLRRFWRIFKKIPPFSWLFALLERMETMGEPKADTEVTLPPRK